MLYMIKYYVAFKHIQYMTWRFFKWVFSVKWFSVAVESCCGWESGVRSFETSWFLIEQNSFYSWMFWVFMCDELGDDLWGIGTYFWVIYSKLSMTSIMHRIVMFLVLGDDLSINTYFWVFMFSRVCYSSRSLLLLFAVRYCLLAFATARCCRCLLLLLSSRSKCEYQ